jgi:geranylgeranyl pyrophosphate synthase
MKMDPLSLIKQPIEQEFSEFTELFSQTLTHGDHLLAEVLSHIRQRGGKRMRPILTLLIAKNYGGVTMATQHAAIGLELLHTASLVHDDVVDESEERRGQASVNATYNNKVAVLTGDFILSTALLNVSYSKATAMTRTITIAITLGAFIAEVSASNNIKRARAKGEIGEIRTDTRVPARLRCLRLPPRPWLYP